MFRRNTGRDKNEKARSGWEKKIKKVFRRKRDRNAGAKKKKKEGTE